MFNWLTCHIRFPLKDVLSRQPTDGVVYSKKTTTICGLVDQERQIGQGNL